MEDWSVLRNVLFGVALSVGFGHKAYKLYQQKRGEVPQKGRLDEAYVRAELKRGRRANAIRAWRELTGEDLRTARASIARIEAELGLPTHAS